MRFTDLLAPLAAQWVRRVRDELDVVPRPLDSGRQTVAGIDPDRILILGNGPAIGFGVLTQELALSGRLARHLAASTGRGVVVDVLARRGITAAIAPRLLDGMRMEHYDAVVLCVGSSDAYSLLPEERWRSDLGRLIDAVRDATTPTTLIAVLGIRPLQRPGAAHGPAGGLVDAHARRLDRIAREVCTIRPGVIHIVTETALAEAPRSSAAYDRLAGILTPALATELDALAARPAGDAVARALRSCPDPEEARQGALERSGLVDSGSNPRLDRLLGTARDLFGLAGAAVTLVDGDRVVFKAAVGTPTHDVPRSIAPCDRTIRQNGTLVLGDLRGEPISRDGWRFYAGHPLESPDGYRIGALCLIDTQERDPLTVDRVALAEIAARVEAELWAEVQRTPDTAPDRTTPSGSAEALVARFAAD